MHMVRSIIAGWVAKRAGVPVRGGRGIPVLIAGVLMCCPAWVLAQAPPPTEPPVDAAKDAESAAKAAEEAALAVADRPPVPEAPADAATAAASVRDAMEVMAAQAEVDPASVVLVFGDTFDWVRTSSGEWVRGNVERVREDVLEFDSEEFGDQNIDLEDVALLHSPQINTYVFLDRSDATGRAVLIGDNLIIETEEGIKVFPRSDIESIVEGDARERNWWSTTLLFGLTFNRGNANQLTYNINWDILREDQLTRLFLNYNGTFGKVDGTQTVNRNLGTLNLSVFVHEIVYVVPIGAQLLNDKFQNIKFRAAPFAAIGIHMIDKQNGWWDFQTGVGYQYLKFLSPAAGVTNPQNDAFVPFNTFGEVDITGDIDWHFSWLTNLVVTTIGNTNHTGETGFGIEVTDIVDFAVDFLYLRTERPPPRETDTGPVPVKKNDYQLVFSVGVDLG